MVGVFALYGDTGTALELKSRTASRPGPMGHLMADPPEAVLASVLGHFDEAEQHLATLSSVVRDFAAPRGEAACVVGYAKVALDRGDYARASRLLAALNASAGPEGRPFRSGFDALVYDHCTGALRHVLDPEMARITHAEGSALSLKEALDAELSRSGTATAQ
jgi:hypothetical protein